ncbi:MAG: DUF2165 family protein [Candidatus Methylacidiphilaceae bacterium]
MPFSVLALRASKTLLPFLIGIYFFLAAIDNVADPSPNRAYLVHALAMDTVPRDTRLIWRAVRSPTASRLLFGGLVAWEFGTALLCMAGAARLLRAWSGNRQEFFRAKSWALVGLTCGLVQWLCFFLILAGEWFQLWRGSLSPALDVAARMFALTALCLIYLAQAEDDPESTRH